MTSHSVVPGIYRHYKGQYYEVLDIGSDTETKKDFVVYRALYGEYRLWIRALSMFVESVSVDGSNVPRFELVRPFGSKSHP
jgi:hypothetical protein